MKCCLSDLRYKEVIDMTTGQRLGYVCDAEIDLEEGKIVSLIVPGQKSSAVCSAAMMTTFCRGNPSPDWARISFSQRSRRSSRAAGGKSGRIISDELKKRQKYGQFLLHCPYFSGIIPEHYARGPMCDHVVSAWSGTVDAPGGSN